MTTSRSLRRRTALNLGLLILALWAAFSLAVEVRHLLWRQVEDRWLATQPCLWRYGTPPTDRLERFLDGVRPVLAEDGTGSGDVVLFSSPFAGREELCAYLWASYLLPEATLRRVPPDTTAESAGSRRLRFDPRTGAGRADAGESVSGPGSAVPSRGGFEAHTLPLAATTVGAVVLLSILCLGAGEGVVRVGETVPRVQPSASGRSLAFVAGMLVLHLLLLAASLFGLAWTRWSILALLGAAAVTAGTAHRLALRDRREEGRPVAGTDEEPARIGRPGPGDLVASISLAVFASLTVTGWLIFPDLVYHWGIKAGKFALAGGIDFRFLAAPTDFSLHPDYPLLLVDLVAATQLVSGSAGPWAGMAWGPVLALVIWLAARGWLAEAVSTRSTFQLAVAAVGLYLSFSAVAFRRTTDAGWLLALALVAAAPALVRRLSRPGDDLRVGLAAGLAVAAKLEGMPLALFMIVATAWPRGLRADEEEALPRAHRRWWAILLPPAVVGLPWAALVARHDLWAETNWIWGSVEPERLVTVLGAIAEVAARPPWDGFGLLTLLLPGLLWFSREMRPLAAVLTLQIGFYLLAYLATPVEVVHLVETSFARLLGHLTPVALVAGVVLGTRADSQVFQER